MSHYQILINRSGEIKQYTKFPSLYRVCEYECGPHRVGGNRKRNQQSTNAGQKSIETVFSIVICHTVGDKWQSKALFLMIFIHVPG